MKMNALAGTTEQIVAKHLAVEYLNTEYSDCKPGKINPSYQ